MKNKKIIITACIIVIIVFLIFITIWGISKGKNKSTKIEQPTLSLSKVFDLEDVQNKDIPIKKSNKETASIALGTNTYIVDAKIDFIENKTGKMIYSRENNSKTNIFQVKYIIDKDDNLVNQIRRRMDNFIEMCSSYVGVRDEEKISETIGGKDVKNAEKPLEECIYNDNEKYDITYQLKYEYKNKNDDDIYDIAPPKQYEITIYKKDNYLVCEFINVL